MAAPPAAPGVNALVEGLNQLQESLRNLASLRDWYINGHHWMAELKDNIPERPHRLHAMRLIPTDQLEQRLAILKEEVEDIEHVLAVKLFEEEQ